jgi:aminopeptidase N
VGWATYHDQWLSEGFADFSAALFLQLTGKQEEFLKYMERQRKRIVEKNNFGLRANDAGPLWLGIRLDTFKSPRAYNNMVYPKGAFVVQMLRSLMWDKDTQDKDFIALMHDFVATEFNQNASTERFRALVTKHMKPSMDLGGDHTMNWFFNEWVYAADLPRYRLDYSLQPAADGKVQLTGTLTQSEVSKDFRMKVPIYAEIDKQMLRLGSAFVAGNGSSPEFKLLLPKRPKRVGANLLADVLAVETVNQEK